MNRKVRYIVAFLGFGLILSFRSIPLHAQDKSSIGSFDGRSRLFFSHTDNTGDFTDYFASAIGVGGGYTSPVFRNFHFRTSAFLTQGLLTSDLNSPDPISGAFNRYEIGLFDVLNPEKRSIFRWEELYLQYTKEKSYLRVGRQLIATPFINPQDGRMSPTFVQGIYGRWEMNSQWALEGGWLNGISPRSTSRWFGVGESMGAYPQGLSADGHRANYLSHVDSKGIGLISLQYEPVASVKLKAWNTFVENVQNMFLAQADADPEVGDGWHALAGLQYTRLDALAFGGNEDPALTYIQPDCFNNIISARIGVRKGRGDFSINYTHISSTARFQFPREWGRDPFYTFMPRERNEGYGGVEALVLRSQWQVIPGKWTAELSHGWFDMPAANDARVNKYGIPSYHQTNLDLRFKASDKLSIQYLVVYKGRNGDDFGNPRYVINKVDMLLQNLVLNMSF
jgi:hypothetical protein